MARNYLVSIIRTYTLTENTQIAGQEYGNAIPEALTFTTVTDSLFSLTRTEVGPDEDTPGDSNLEKLTLEKDKGTVGQTADKRKIITSANISGKVFIETKTISQPGKDEINIRVKETSTISDDGKTLTLVKEFEDLADTNDKWSVKGTYTKKN